MTGKGDFRYTRIQLIYNLAIDNSTHLKILVDCQTSFVARAVHTLRHQRVACFVRLTKIAIDSAPTWFAFAFLLVIRAGMPIRPISKRVAGW